jgi:4-amino-4-deoxy-L-arabinose transferase-like glycosyltransferase
MREILESRRTVIALICCFIGIAALDLIIPGKTRLPDEATYIEVTKTLSETGEFVMQGKRAAAMPMLEIIYLPFYKAFGPGAAFIKSVRVLQCLAHMVMSVAAGFIAFSLFKRKSAVACAMFGSVIYPSFVAYQSILMTETFFTCFLTLGFAFLYAWTPEHPGRFFVSALFFMLALYTRPVITIMMPFFFLSAGLRIFDNWRTRLKYCLYACLLFAVCLSPWWIRNWRVFGKFVSLTTGTASNFYLGNNKGNLTGGVEWETDADKDELRDILSAGDEFTVEKSFSERAMVFIRENKMIFLKNMWIKFKRFWNFKMNADIKNLPRYFFYFNIASSIAWSAAFFLALATVWRYGKKWIEFLPIFVLIAYFTFVHVVTIASLRYRVPIEPFFLILGADSLGLLFERLRIAR